VLAVFLLFAISPKLSDSSELSIDWLIELIIIVFHCHCGVTLIFCLPAYSLRSGFSIANQIKFDLRFTDLRLTWCSELIVDQLCFVFPCIFDLKLRDWWLVGTNLIHHFMAVTFSVKLAFFREKCRFPWNPWFFANFSAFSLIYDNFRVLSAAFVRMLLFATCCTSALSSWHWLSWVLTLCSKYLLFWNFFVCISTAPWNNVCVAREFPKLFPWNLTHFKNSAMKSCIFSREFGWSLAISWSAVNWAYFMPI